MSVGQHDVFSVLAEPHRRRILDLLLDGPQPAGAIGATFTLSQPTVSKHLRVLREAGMVTVHHRAQQRWYYLDATSLHAMDQWLRPYRDRWSTRLDALEEHLDTMADE